MQQLICLLGSGGTALGTASCVYIVQPHSTATTHNPNMPAQKRLRRSKRIKAAKAVKAKKPKRASERARSKQQSGRGIKNFLNKVINKLPIEMHWPGHNFTGPGTKLERRLDSNDKPLPNSKPVNRVDESSMHHDLCYRDNRTRAGRTKCDWDMVNRLKNINKPSIRERLERTIIGGIIGGKARLGI